MLEVTAEALRALLPEGRVLTDPDAMDAYTRDQTYAVPGAALAVVLARDTADVAATMAWAQERRGAWTASRSTARRG
ncbi:hypothetical protein GCM10023178_62560 [Actinomadura luteofluorescens]